MPGGVCALNLDGPVRVWRPEIGESERSLIAFEVAIDWARRIGFRYVERASYRRDGVPGRRGPRWPCGEEPVHIFARPGAVVYFDERGCTVPARRPGKSPAGYSTGKGRRRTRTPYEQSERKMLSTSIEGHVDSNAHLGHPAPFARALADAFVLCYSAPGDLVCDPFVGSGTVAAACWQAAAFGDAPGSARRSFVGGDRGHRERDGRRWADVALALCSQGTLDFRAQLSNA